MTKKSTIIIGIVFLLVGILGFFNNPIVGSEGYFITNLSHDLVHLLTGLALLFVGLKTKNSSLALKIFGLVYLLVAVLGLLVTQETGSGHLLGFIHINGTDNWLHLILGIVIFLLGARGDSEMM